MDCLRACGSGACRDHLDCLTFLHLPRLARFRAGRSVQYRAKAQMEGKTMTYEQAARAANDAIAKAMRLSPDHVERTEWRKMYFASNDLVDNIAEEFKK